MSIPKLKVYRLDKEYIQSNDTDIQSVNADELYPVVPKPLDPNYANLLVGVEHRDSAVVLKDTVDDTAGTPTPYYAIVGMKPIYDEEGEISSYSFTTTDKVECDGWRLDKKSIKLYLKKTPLSEVVTGEIGEDALPEDIAEWTEYTNKENWRILFENETIAYDDTGAEIEDIESNASLIVGRREKKSLSIELGSLLFLDSAFWVDELLSLDDYTDFRPIDRIAIEYQMYKDVLSDALVSDYETDSIMPFGNIYNGKRTGFANSKDYPDKLLINEGNYVFKRQIYPLRQLVAQTPAKALLVETNDFYQDVEIQSSGTIDVFNTANWIQSGELAPALFERITVYDNEGAAHVIYKEMELNTQYTRSPLVSYVDGEIRGKYVFNLISNYYRVSDGIGGSSIKFPSEVFIRYNEVDDCIGDVFDFDYDYNKLSGETIVENDTVGEYENTGVCTFVSSPDGYIYKKKNILAIQSTSGSLTENDLEITITDPAVSQSFILPDGAYFDANYPLEIYDNGVKIYDSVSGDVTDSYAVSYVEDTVWTTITLTLDTSLVLPEDVMVIYYEKKQIGFGKVSGETYNYWCMGYRVSCWEKSELTDTFVSPHPNWVSNHLNNNPDIFKGYVVYEGTGSEGAPTSGLTYYFLENGYNIYYRDGYVVLSEMVSKILTINEAKNFAGFDPEDMTVNGFKTSTSGVRANYAYYAGLINLTGAIVRNYSARGSQYLYKIFDDNLYPDSIEKRMILRNDSYMPSFFECGGKNLPDINMFEGELLTKFTSTSVTYGQGIRINTVNNRLSSVLFNFNTSSNKSWIKVFVNHNYSGENTIINDEGTQLIDGDIPVYCLYYDGVSVSLPYESGSLYIGEDDVTPVGFVIEGSDLVEIERMDDIFPEGTSFYGTEAEDVVDTISSFTYSNESWNYDVVFELLGYRGSSSVEFLVYRQERE